MDLDSQRHLGRLSTLVLLGGVLLASCAHPVVKTQALETTHCDPNERDDCWSVPHDVLRALALDSAENEKLKAAMKFCQQGSL